MFFIFLNFLVCGYCSGIWHEFIVCVINAVNRFLRKFTAMHFTLKLWNVAAREKHLRALEM